LRIALLGPRMDALLGPRMDQEGLKATCPDGREAPISHASTSTAKKLKASFVLALSQSTAARWASRSLAPRPKRRTAEGVHLGPQKPTRRQSHKRGSSRP
jgi:hypothetical protein